MTDSDGRLIFMKLIINSIDYCIVNLYAPNDPRKAVDFIEKVCTVMSNEDVEATENILIGGDFKVHITLTGFMFQTKL